MKVRYIISAVFVVLSCTALAQAQSGHTFISAHGIYNTTCGTLGGAGVGFEVEGGDLNIERCEASNNDIGIQSSILGSEAATVTVSNSIVTNNKSFGFLAYGGSDFQSLGNNIVRRNGTNTSGTITSISGT